MSRRVDQDADRRVGHLSRSITCAVCGCQFSIPRQGRPSVVCGDSCQRERRRQQKRAIAADPAQASAMGLRFADAIDARWSGGIRPSRKGR